jgi:hypothetical protein
MAEQGRLVTFEGKTMEFPADATDAEISAALGAIPSANAPNAPKAKTWTALALSSVKPLVEGSSRVAAEVATNPNMRSLGSTAGQIVGGIAGAKTLNPLNVAGGVWAGGRAGWHTGALAQKLATPVAKALEAVAPYAQAASTLAGAQGVNDLAQIAEPDRKDIGVLGVGRTTHIRNDPAAVARVIKASPSIGDAVAALVQLGMPQGEAVRTVWNARVKAQ